MATSYSQKPNKRSVSHAVPAANVIDLRKKKADKDKIPEAAPKSSWLQRVAIFFQSRKREQKKETKTRIATEKVIVSNASLAKEAVKPARKKQALPKKRPLQEKIVFGQFSPSQGWYKSLLAFVVIIAILITPFFGLALYKRAKQAEGKVMGLSSTAYENLQQAGSSAADANVVEAKMNFMQAANNFSLAKQQLQQAGSLIVSVAGLIPGKVQSANSLLEAGEHISTIGELLTGVLEYTASIEINPLNENESSMTDYLQYVKNQIEPAQEELDQAVANMEKVRIKDLPDEYRDSISTAKETLPMLKDNFKDFDSLADILLAVLGQDSPKRYLLIFQNNRELRPTGGFIGSIALADINKGNLTNLEVPGGGVYDVAGQLQEKIIAPKPLWLVNPHWNIQDSNWFPDFPASAEKLMWFFERTGKTSVDGVLSLTPTVIEKLLEITGPIEMLASYNTVVDQDNFIRQAQYWAEVEYDREENKPKKFIGDLLPTLLNKVFQTEPDHLMKVISVLVDSLTSRDLLFYFNDENVQQAIHDFGWDGAIRPAEKDYLYVVNTNIGGGKTDQVVDQFIEHQAHIKEDGSVVNAVTITRKHNGNPLDRWGGQANVSYIRLYVPRGSTLISAQGFTEIPAFRYQLPDSEAVVDSDLESIQGSAVIDEASQTRITNEFGKTVFGNWISLDPGEVVQATIVYSVPFTVAPDGLFDRTDTYQLLVQKQPGAINNYFSSEVFYDADYEVIWRTEGASFDSGAVRYISDLVKDLYFGFVIRK